MAKNQDIEVVDNPVDVINAGSAIFILSMGNYADKPATVQILKDGQLSTIGNATMMAYDSYNDQLYMINAPYGGDKEYKVYNLKNGQTTTFLTNPDIFSPYSLTVNPVNGDVFITSHTKNPDTGKAHYTADCKLYRYTSAGILLGTYDCGVNPGTIVCDSYYQK